MRTVFLLLALLAGCQTYPAGQPVRLMFPEDLPVLYQDVIRNGAKLWNQCGARVLDRGDQTPAAEIYINVCPYMFNGWWGEYRYDTGDININSRLVDDSVDPRFLLVVAAHETGHAFGLDHWEDGDESIMRHVSHANFVLSQRDKDEWARATGLACP